MLQLVLISGAILAIALPRYTTCPPPSLRCGKCSEGFVGDGRSNRGWFCPHCGKKNPNLRLHYHSVATLIAIVACYGAFSLLVRLLSGSLGLVDVGWGLTSLLSAAAATTVFKSPAPWNDTKARALLWGVVAVDLLAALVDVVRVAAMLGRAPAEAWVVGILLSMWPSLFFGYVVWLQQMGKKLTASSA